MLSPTAPATSRSSSALDVFLDFGEICILYFASVKLNVIDSGAEQRFIYRCMIFLFVFLKHKLTKLLQPLLSGGFMLITVLRAIVIHFLLGRANHRRTLSTC